jgi:hypothetical protein
MFNFKSINKMVKEFGSNDTHHIHDDELTVDYHCQTMPITKQINTFYGSLKSQMNIRLIYNYLEKD